MLGWLPPEDRVPQPVTVATTLSSDVSITIQYVKTLLIIALAGIRQASRKHSAGEGDWSGELDDGKVIVIAAVVGVTDPLAGKNIVTM